MNPCPCGFYGSQIRECTCTASQIQKYQKKISGPILDRIDIKIYVPYLGNQKVLEKFKIQQKCIQDRSAHIHKNSIQFYTHDVVKNNIEKALRIQESRYLTTNLYNGNLSSSQLTKFIHLSPVSQQHLTLASENLHLSTRALLKIIRLSRTIADLDSSSEIKVQHISEAISFNQP